jgi:hypothetical protein
VLASAGQADALFVGAADADAVLSAQGTVSVAFAGGLTLEAVLNAMGLSPITFVGSGQIAGDAELRAGGASAVRFQSLRPPATLTDVALAQSTVLNSALSASSVGAAAVRQSTLVDIEL